MNELVATCWTHAGDAAPLRGDEVSPLNILDRVRVAAETGFVGIGFVYADLMVAKHTIGWERLAKEIQNLGYKYTEVEFLSDWWSDGEARRESDTMRSNLLEAASLLDARFIKVSGSMSEEPETGLLESSFYQLAEDAASAGTKIALEPMPFSNFRTVPEASQFVERVGHPAGGLMIDAWHVYRAGNKPKDLIGKVKGQSIFGVELNDAYEPAPAFEDLFSDTTNNRVAPGHGDWDIPELIEVLRQIGYHGPWGVELISEVHRKRSLQEALRIAYDSTIRVLDQADETLTHQ